jgi:tetratricopeptide (TPR) repeat protein
MRCLISLFAAGMLLAAGHCAWAESSGEVVGGDDTPPVKPEPQPAPPPPPNNQDTGPVSRLPLTVDEPDFKATVKFPEKPQPRIDQDTRPKEGYKPRRREFVVPQEEGFEKPEGDATEDSDNKASDSEEISEILAKAIAKEKSGKKMKDMVPVYQEIVNAAPEDAAAHYRLGIAMIRTGDLAKGLPELENSLKLKPRNSKYLCDYGLACLRAGWVEKALVACQMAAFAMPANGRYQSAAGDALLASGKISEAADAYSRAVNLEPKNTDYMHNLGKAYLVARAYKRAGEVFDEAIRLRPDYSPYYCSRGLAFQSLKNVKDAVQCYMVAIKLDKNDAYAHYLLAGCYSDPDDPTYTNRIEAMDHAEKACKLTDFKNPQYLMGMARVLRLGLNYDQAVALARKAIELDPRDEYRQELAKFEQLRTEGGRK